MLEPSVLPILREEDLNEVIALQLNQFRVDSILSLEDFNEWIVRLCPVATIPTFMKVNISRYIESQIKNFKNFNLTNFHTSSWGMDTTEYMQPSKTSTGTVEFEVLTSL